MIEGRVVPYLRVANVFDGYIDYSDINEMPFKQREIETFRLRPGDILLNEGQSVELVGRCAMYADGPEDCCFQNTLIRYRAGPQTDANFAIQLFRYCQAIGIFSRIAVKTNSIAHLGVSRFAELELPFPPLSEQRKIAEILRTWDAAIEKLEALRAANLHRRIWMRTHLFTGRTRLPSYTGEWREVALGEVLTEHGLQGTGAEEVFSVSVHKGLINQIEHLGRSFAAADTGHYNRVLPGDIVYTKSPTGDFPLGIIKQSKISAEVIVSPLYGVFTPATRALGVILDALFESPIAVRNYLHPLVQKGAKNTIAITNRRFLEGKLNLPMDPAEQAAIAAVVEASQDELTAIEAEIEALTRQKRGLMQKLLTGEWRLKVEAD
jgi:type I restriction enzyme S subunit